MIHHLYIALCAHHPKSRHLPSLYICATLPFIVPPPLLLGWLPDCCLCLWVLFVCFSCLFICCFQFISHTWARSYGSWLFLSDLFCWTWCSKIHPCCHKWEYWTFSCLSGIPLSIWTKSSVFNHPPKDILLYLILMAIISLSTWNARTLL